MSKRYTFHNVLRICREDIAEVTNEATAGRLTEDDIAKIAVHTADVLLETGFWDVLREVCDYYIQEMYPEEYKEGGDTDA